MGYTYTDFAGLRVPDENAADDVPADLSFLAEQLDTAVVLKAVSTADRDSKFYDAPSGVICVVRSSPGGVVSGVYIKTSDAGSATWGTIWEPPSALELVQLTLNDQYTTRGTPTYDPGVYREPGGIFAQMSGAIVRVDGAQIQSSSVVGYLPSGYLPLRQSNDYAVAITSSSAYTTSEPKVSLSGDGSITYYGTPTNWLGFDSIRYFLAQS
ncbi:hypothetical protein SEA_LAZERLEMON_29 [Streptomyces phage LazerLemon]|nr:hypothetical protein SEA_LAZERLEMON_29 [Streptomyces phage LazerLemon]